MFTREQFNLIPKEIDCHMTGNVTSISVKKNKGKFKEKENFGK